jgi:hypothetical protein
MEALWNLQPVQNTDQRNALLKKIAHSGADTWDWNCGTHGSLRKLKSVEQAKAFVTFIQEKLATDYALISETKISSNSCTKPIKKISISCSSRTGIKTSARGPLPWGRIGTICLI